MPKAATSQKSRGIGYGVACYGIWTLFPLYFLLIAAASPLETIMLAPFAAGFMIWIQANGTSSLFNNGHLHLAAMLMMGVITGVPIMLFQTAARKLSLISLGLLQYIVPVGQFILGIVLFKKSLPPARLAEFILIWVAIGVLSLDRYKSAWNTHNRIVNSK